jgi:molecular chaperone GrpE (heat shock protein)
MPSQIATQIVDAVSAGKATEVQKLVYSALASNVLSALSERKKVVAGTLFKESADEQGEKSQKETEKDEEKLDEDSTDEVINAKMSIAKAEKELSDIEKEKMRKRQELENLRKKRQQITARK